MLEARLTLNQPIRDCRLYMVFDGRWKLIHATGFRPMLFELEGDPGELCDLGADPGFAGERARLRDELLDWALRDHNRITTTDARIENYARGQQLRSGILIGYWDEAELAAARARQDPA
jgi:arylsulfatase A-like enzyme